MEQNKGPSASLRQIQGQNQTKAIPVTVTVTGQLYSSCSFTFIAGKLSHILVL